MSKSLLENVEKSFDPVTVDVGLNENNEICIRFYPDTDEYEVGYLIRTVSTDYEYSDVFYIVRKYKNERDAMKRVSYLNGGKYE